MLRPILQDSFLPVAESDLDAFEIENDCGLPPDYRTFLLEQNGGYFRQLAAFGNAKELISVNMFYAVKAGYDWADLRFALRDFRQHQGFPREFIPAGDDGLGNPICVCESSRATKVAIWNHETGHSRLICDTFESFSNGIYYAPEQESMWIEINQPFKAAERGDIELIQSLPASDIDQRNEDGFSVLACAVAGRQPMIVRHLIARGANTLVRTKENKTLLILAAEAGGLDNCKALLDAGVPIDARDNDGRTALMSAIQYGAWRIAICLLDAGADPSQVDNFGNTVRSLCELNAWSRENIIGRL